MAMTNAGFDGTVNEAQYAMMWAIGGFDGVENDAAWRVTAGTGRQVSVAAQSGWAFAKGVVSKETVALTANLSTPTNGQFFLIVRHIDWTSNAVTIVALAHTTTSTTVPTTPPTTFPTVSNTPGVVYDHPLGWAWVNSVNTTVTLFDLRNLGPARPIRRIGTTAERTAATAVRDGDLWVDTTDTVTYRRSGAAWKPWETVTPISYYSAGTTLVNYTASTDTPVQTWSARAGRIVCEGKLNIVSGGGFAGGFAVLLPPAIPASAKYNVSGRQEEIGRALYNAGAGYPAACVIAGGTIDRVVPSVANVAGTYASYSSAITASVPVAQAIGYTLTWSFEYDPA